MRRATFRKEYNELLLSEINQYHSVVKDFSNQSTSIKKLSITIYITFLSAYYGVKDFFNSPIPKEVFFLIGIVIPLLCYIYEIYIDIIRQKMRIQMQNKIEKYKKINGIPNAEGSGILVIKFSFIKFAINDGFCYLTRACEKQCNRRIYYVNLLHGMYIMYLLQIGIVILAGCYK